jgi:pimeloyl-ACP methyl ester carboxylesterase
LSADPGKAVAEVQDFLQRLERKPLPAGREPLTEAIATSAILSFLYFPAVDYPRLATALAAGFDGDGSLLLALFNERTSRNPDGTFNNNQFDAFYAVTCLDHPTTGGVKRVEELAQKWAKAAPTWGEGLAWGNLPCNDWPLAGKPRTKPITAAGSGPILVVSTKYDPATPYQWGVRVARNLANGHLLSYDGEGHTAYTSGSACIDKAVDAYLVSGVLPPDGTRCPVG